MKIKEVSQLLGKNPREIRRAARKLFGRLPPKEKWDFSSEQVGKLEEFFRSRAETPSGGITVEMEGESQ